MTKALAKQLKAEKDKVTARTRLTYIRIAPRKMRIVIDTIRHKHPDQAFYILAGLNKKAARIVEKMLKTAVANAKVLGLDESRLFISDVRADGGPMMKRFMERSMGRADRILKRTTHVSLSLSEGAKKFTSSAALEAKESEKETSKPAKGLLGRKKKTAAAKS